MSHLHLFCLTLLLFYKNLIFHLFCFIFNSLFIIPQACNCSFLSIVRLTMSFFQKNVISHLFLFLFPNAPLFRIRVIVNCKLWPIISIQVIRYLNLIHLTCTQISYCSYLYGIWYDAYIFTYICPTVPTLYNAVNNVFSRISYNTRQIEESDTWALSV
jgi:hypothetical protein